MYGKRCTLLNILVERTLLNLAEMHYIAFSGTKLSITIVESIMSSVSKSDEKRPVRKPDEIEAVFLQGKKDVMQFLSLHINTAMLKKVCEKKEIISMLYGQKRIATSFLLNMAEQMLTKSPTQEQYKSVIHSSIVAAYSKMVTDLSERLVKQAKKSSSMYFHLSI